jgi:DNA ligase-1
VGNVTDLPLAELVQASSGAAATRSRLKKRQLLADCLRAAGAEQAALAVSYLSGVLPQGKIGLGRRHSATWTFRRPRSKCLPCG